MVVIMQKHGNIEKSVIFRRALSKGRQIGAYESMLILFTRIRIYYTHSTFFYITAFYLRNLVSYLQNYCPLSFMFNLLISSNAFEKKGLISLISIKDKLFI